SLPGRRLFYIADRTTGTCYLVDTGAEVSAVPAKRADQSQTPIYYLWAVNNSSIPVHKERSITLNLGLRRAYRLVLLVAEVSSAVRTSCSTTVSSWTSRTGACSTPQRDSPYKASQQLTPRASRQFAITTRGHPNLPCRNSQASLELLTEPGQFRTMSSITSKQRAHRFTSGPVVWLQIRRVLVDRVFRQRLCRGCCDRAARTGALFYRWTLRTYIILWRKID
ncbi:unnamed protein product, partial [Ixodes hexagonus]